MVKKKKQDMNRNPKGNPEFGVTIKPPTKFDEPLTERVMIRLTKSQKERLDRQPKGFARDAVLKVLDEVDSLSSYLSTKLENPELKKSAA